MTKQAENRQVLGVRIDITRMEEVLEMIRQKAKGKRQNYPKHRPFWMVTAYSETFVEAGDDLEYAKALAKADWVVLDGVGSWMAVDYPTQGIRVIWNAISGKYTDRPVGAEMVKRLLEERKYKIFLLGGFGGVAQRLANKYDCQFDNGDSNVQSTMPNDQSNLKIINKINKFKPGILLVAYGRVKQEMWIARNLEKLKCKVVMGVGSSFDEIMGEGVWMRKTPAWVEQVGLKWLWRLINDPKHLYRVWRAVIVFPWRVFRSS